MTMTATALIQCVMRSQSGWIVAGCGGAGTASCGASRLMAHLYTSMGQCCSRNDAAHFTVMVMISDITGGSCGMWLQLPSTSCSVCCPGGSVTMASVWPPP